MNIFLNATPRGTNVWWEQYQKQLNKEPVIIQGLHPLNIELDGPVESKEELLKIVKQFKKNNQLYALGK